MQKIAYSQELEKLASRAWKKNIGNLSEDNQQKLVETGVLNRNKELKGLRKGTSVIIGKERIGNRK